MSGDIQGGGAEKRVERRVAANLQVTVDNMDDIKGITRDVSASGLFFETGAAIPSGATIHLLVEIDTPTGRRILKCQGSVVRVETLENRLGLAVKITDSKLVRPT
jgi:hypothetical protein